MQTTEVTAGELATALERLVVWLRRNAAQPVSASTASALNRLATEGPLRVSELAEREAMTQPGVTVLVNRLAEAGYAERAADPTDRRATLVRLTDAGRALLVERHAARAELLRERLEQLDDADRRALLAATPALDRLLTVDEPDTSPTRKNAR
ncbi:MarR family winged helix-turn-helix transcriptional regulator [uncultured Jatrophihabitans sp.]|uniref:MarR family winged helix-turn-helix transcriptional regulator n=1 Tax=uncultured Jatrophihabitans sp. TaxID=1610747 RepID=UPI0035CC37C1